MGAVWSLLQPAAFGQLDEELASSSSLASSSAASFYSNNLANYKQSPPTKQPVDLRRRVGAGEPGGRATRMQIAAANEREVDSGDECAAAAQRRRAAAAHALRSAYEQRRPQDCVAVSANGSDASAFGPLTERAHQLFALKCSHTMEQQHSHSHSQSQQQHRQQQHLQHQHEQKNKDRNNNNNSSKQVAYNNNNANHHSATALQKKSNHNQNHNPRDNSNNINNSCNRQQTTMSRPAMSRAKPPPPPPQAQQQATKRNILQQQQVGQQQNSSSSLIRLRRPSEPRGEHAGDGQATICRNSNGNKIFIAKQQQHHQQEEEHFSEAAQMYPNRHGGNQRRRGHRYVHSQQQQQQQKKYQHPIHKLAATDSNSNSGERNNSIKQQQQVSKRRQQSRAAVFNPNQPAGDQHCRQPTAHCQRGADRQQQQQQVIPTATAQNKQQQHRGNQRRQGLKQQQVNKQHLQQQHHHQQQQRQSRDHRSLSSSSSLTCSSGLSSASSSPSPAGSLLQIFPPINTNTNRNRNSDNNAAIIKRSQRQIAANNATVAATTLAAGGDIRRQKFIASEQPISNNSPPSSAASSIISSLSLATTDDSLDSNLTSSGLGSALSGPALSPLSQLSNIVHHPHHIEHQQQPQHPLMMSSSLASFHNIINSVASQTININQINLEWLAQQATKPLPNVPRADCAFPKPPPRPWRQVAGLKASKVERALRRQQLGQGLSPMKLQPEFTAISYNILSDRLVNRAQFPVSPEYSLEWFYRRELILRQLLEFDADLIALQELEAEHYETYFKIELERRANYQSIYAPKSRAKTMDFEKRKKVDGCAIFFKQNKFRMTQQHVMEFSQIAMANSAGSEAMINRVMTKDNIGIACILEFIDDDDDDNISQLSQATDSSGRTSWSGNGSPSPVDPIKILVCNTHIHWNPEHCDVKLIQTIMLMNELESIARGQDNSSKALDDTTATATITITPPKNDLLPLVLLGDFNSTPNSGVIDYLTNGCINSLHEDFKDFKYTKCTKALARINIDYNRRQSSPAANAATSTTNTSTSASLLSSSPPYSCTPATRSSSISHSISPTIETTKSAATPSSYAQPNVLNYRHSFQLSSAYEKNIMPYTNFRPEFKDVIDYVFYSSCSMHLIGLLGPLDNNWLRTNKIEGLPQPHIPSDHLPLLVKFKLNDLRHSTNNGALQSKQIDNPYSLKHERNRF